MKAPPSVFPLLLQNDQDRMEQLVLVRMSLLCALLLVPKHSVAMLVDLRCAARTKDRQDCCLTVLCLAKVVLLASIEWSV